MPGACGIDDRGRDARAPGKPQVALSYYHPSPRGLWTGVPEDGVAKRLAGLLVELDSRTAAGMIDRIHLTVWYWELGRKETMRYTLAAMLLTGLVCTGCAKPKPKAPEAAPPAALKAAATRELRPMDLPAEPKDLTAPDPVLKPAPVVTARPVAEPKPVAAPTQAGTMYTIKKGDTFIKIAREVYGNAGRMKDIQAANPGLDPGKLRVGQTIVLPPK